MKRAPDFPCKCGHELEESPDGQLRSCRACGRRYERLATGWEQTVVLSALRDPVYCEHWVLEGDFCEKCEEKKKP
jgi:hypothetical protein